MWAPRIAPLLAASVLAGLLGPALVGPALVGPAAAAEAPSYDEVWRFTDPDIIESSGLVVTDEHVITVNDSGDSGRVFAVSLETGETVGVTRWEDDPRDVEALAPAGDGQVWVGDIGDNLRRRDSIEVLKVPVGPGERTVTPERHTLTYPDGAADAETLLAHPETGRLLVVTKGVFGGTVFEAPETLDPDGANPLVEIGPVVGIATDGAFFPDGRHLVIRTYGRVLVYSYPSFEVVGSFDAPHQQQGEGIAVAPDDTVYVSSEGLRSPFLRIDLPDDVRRAMAGEATEPPEVSASPDPPAEPSEAPETEPGFVDADGEPFRRDAWPWLAGTGVALVALVLLIRSLREPRRR